MKGFLLALTFIVATTVAIQKDPRSLLDFQPSYRMRNGVIASAYRETVGRVKYAVSESIRLMYGGWRWTRGTILD